MIYNLCRWHCRMVSFCTLSLWQNILLCVRDGWEGHLKKWIRKACLKNQINLYVLLFSYKGSYGHRHMMLKTNRTNKPSRRTLETPKQHLHPLPSDSHKHCGKCLCLPVDSPGKADLLVHVGKHIPRAAAWVLWVSLRDGMATIFISSMCFFSPLFWGTEGGLTPIFCLSFCL